MSGDEGNHGEDVKEQYFYLDNTPTHSYMKCLYKYPQAEFPYRALLDENRRRTRQDPEYELLDTGVFAENRYFDVLVEYAKAAPDDILIRITVSNRGPDAAAAARAAHGVVPQPLVVGLSSRSARLLRQTADGARSSSTSPITGSRYLLLRTATSPRTAVHRKRNRPPSVYGDAPNASPYVKVGIGRYVVHGDRARRESREARHQGGRALHSLRSTPGAIGRAANCASPMPTQSDPFGAAFDADLRRSHSRGR